MCLAVLFVHDALSTPLPSIFIYSLCYTKREGNGEDRKWDREKRNSEAGNRTPVVRVTGGNTKPLYYFGSALAPNLSFMRERTGLALTLKDFSQVRSALLFAAI